LDPKTCIITFWSSVIFFWKMPSTFFILRIFRNYMYVKKSKIRRQNWSNKGNAKTILQFLLSVFWKSISLKQLKCLPNQLNKLLAWPKKLNKQCIVKWLKKIKYIFFLGEIVLGIVMYVYDKGVWNTANHSFANNSQFSILE